MKLKNEEVILIGGVGLFVLWKSGILKGVGSAVEGVGAVIGETGDFISDSMRETRAMLSNLADGVKNLQDELRGQGAANDSGTPLNYILQATPPNSSISTFTGGKVANTAMIGAANLGAAAMGGGTNAAKTFIQANPITSIATNIINQTGNVAAAATGTGGTTGAKVLIASNPVTSIATGVTKLIERFKR